MNQILIRAPEHLKDDVTNEAKRMGISVNALLLYVIGDWNERRKQRSESRRAEKKEEDNNEGIEEKAR